MANTWTLSRLVDKVRDDLELHAEDFVTYEDITEFINDAISDAEELMIDSFSDFLLTFADLEVEEGDTVVDVPDDIYGGRIRYLCYSESGFNSGSPTGETYKLRKIKLEEIADVVTGDCYRYRLINTTASGMQIYIYPAIREDSDDRFRAWYIRKLRRLVNTTDVLEEGIPVQYVLSHVKCSCMKKEGNALLDVELQNLLKQEDKFRSAVSRLTDDDEDSRLEIDDYALDEAYGDEYY